jgi:hypothetical protein
MHMCFIWVVPLESISPLSHVGTSHMAEGWQNRPSKKAGAKRGGGNVKVLDQDRRQNLMC